MSRPALAQDLTRDTIPGRWILPLIPENLPDLTYPSYFSTLEKANLQSFTGRYKLSLITLRHAKIVRPADAITFALIRARSLGAIGQLDEAIAACNDPRAASDPRVLVEKARLLMAEDRLAEATELMSSLVATHPDSIAGHFVLGQCCERAGNVLDAVKAYSFFEPFVDRWQGRDATLFNNAEEVTLIGRGLDRWASLTTQYRTRGALNNIIYGMFTKAYDEIDEEYWPAHLAAAEYALSHDDPQSALKELGAAHQKNPNDLGIQKLLAKIMLQQFNFDAVEGAIDSIRKVDPTSIDAELLTCRDLLAERRPREAMLPVRRVLDRQPRNIEAMGLLAACDALQLHDADTSAALAEVDKVSPADATALYEVAEQLGAMRQYPRSAEAYQKAIARAPWWTALYNGLGLLYTQSGDEDKAAAVLEQARVLDPYNKATTNYMRLLDDLAHFSRKETAHFVVFYDAKSDPVIPEYFGDYLESIYKDVCGEYKQEPPVKTYIEVFPTHAAFSVRTTGSPWIGTVGASTGRVIALVAPRKDTRTMGPFNWAQVLRHEFTHTVTLAATDNRIAHWMTEGLAVVEERTPMRWEWVPMLNNAVTKHELFTMDNLTWGFVRPKRPIDRQLAYAESFWICQYIEQKYGHEAVLKMLAKFREGLEQDQVFPMILGRSMPEFQADFFAWTEQQVAGWGYDAKSTAKYQMLQKKGQQLISQHKYKEATSVWEEAAKTRPVDALPHLRLAGLYLKLHDTSNAVAQLSILEKVSLYDNTFSKKIARTYQSSGDMAQAHAYALRAVYINPYDMEAHQLLADIDQQTHDQPGLEREQRVIKMLGDLQPANSAMGNAMGAP